MKTYKKHAWWNKRHDRYTQVRSFPSPLLVALLVRAGILEYTR